MDEVRLAVAPTPIGSAYVRWPDTGVCTAAQVTGIYKEQFRRTPTPDQLSHELSLHRTPAQL